VARRALPLHGRIEIPKPQAIVAPFHTPLSSNPFYCHFIPS